MWTQIVLRELTSRISISLRFFLNGVWECTCVQGSAARAPALLPPPFSYLTAETELVPIANLPRPRSPELRTATGVPRNRFYTWVKSKPPLIKVDNKSRWQGLLVFQSWVRNSVFWPVWGFRWVERGMGMMIITAYNLSSSVPWLLLETPKRGTKDCRTLGSLSQEARAHGSADPFPQHLSFSLPLSLSIFFSLWWIFTKQYPINK